MFEIAFRLFSNFIYSAVSPLLSELNLIVFKKVFFKFI